MFLSLTWTHTTRLISGCLVMDYKTEQNFLPYTLLKVLLCVVAFNSLPGVARLHSRMTHHWHRRAVTHFEWLYFVSGVLSDLSAHRFSCLAVDRVLPETANLGDSLHRRLHHRLLTRGDWPERSAVDGARQDW